MQPIRQGDVLLLPQSIDKSWRRPTAENKLPHLVLAEGERTGHRHRIEDGKADLYRIHDQLFLKVYSDSALLVHDEHESVEIPEGTWQIRIQREYEQSNAPSQDRQSTSFLQFRGFRDVID